MAGKRGPRSFGHIRKLPSGRYQASYQGPDGKRHNGRTQANRPLTFDTRERADAYLSRIHADIQAGTWQKPGTRLPEPAPAALLRDYAAAWLEDRELSPSTRRLYRVTLGRQILPALGGQAVTAITPAMVRQWHAGLRGATGPTQRAHAYSLLRTILRTAVDDDVIPANPCRVRGGGNAKRVREPRPATIAELAAIAEAMPARYRLMVLLAGWCGLRFGECAELRRGDIDVPGGKIQVSRGVVSIDHAPGEPGVEVKDPKSAAGKRVVAIPPHLMPAVRAHLAEHTGAGARALLFPAAGGRHLAHSTLYRWYYPARAAAGRPDLRFHDLRHTGAVLAAATGATLAELMARLGHSTVSAALRYQHAAADRDKVIAEALSKLAEAATVTPIAAAARGRTPRAKRARG